MIFFGSEPNWSNRDPSSAFAALEFVKRNARVDDPVAKIMFLRLTCSSPLALSSVFFGALHWMLVNAEVAYARDKKVRVENFIVAKNIVVKVFLDGGWNR